MISKEAFNWNISRLKAFHIYGWDSIETEYNMRLNSYSSYVTDFIIHPIQDENKE